MKQSTAMLIVGGVAVATVAVGVVSVVSWSIIPMSIWLMSTTILGNQSMNLMKITTGKLQPTQVIHQHIDGTKVVALKKDA